MPSTITLAQLRGACSAQRDLFKQTFGEQVHLTLELAEKHAADFDSDWAAQTLLPRALLAEYERQKAPLWAEYERQKAPLWAEYERQKAPLWAEYERQEAPLWDEYERQRAPLWAGYQRQKARLFTTLYLSAP